MESEIKQLAAQLAEAGVEYAFGITGSGASWTLITELEARGISYHPASHEASAAIMAGGATTLSGTPALAITIKGPGLANAVPGIAHNHFEHRPVISVSEAYADSAPPSLKHKRLDQVAVLRALVKGILSLDQAGDRLATLLETAVAEPRGPVHLELALHARGMAWIAAEPTRESSASPEIAHARMGEASRPIVIVGALALRRRWREVLPRLRIPVFTTAAAKGAVDEALPYASGVYTGAGKELAPETSVLPQSDLVVGVGLRGDEILRAGFGTIPTLLVDEVELPFSGSEQELPVLADEAATGALLAGLQEREWGLEEIASVKARQRQALLAPAWLPAAAFELLNTALGASYLMVMDTGQFCTIGEHLWLAGPERPYIGASNGRGMGTGLPTAIGAAISDPGRPVICVLGDGGIAAYPAELRLAIEQDLPLCVLLMTDGYYGSIMNAPVDEVRNSRRAVRILGPSWWRAVEAMGCEAHQVTSIEELARQLRDWQATYPLFLEACFPQAEYAVMTRNLR